MRAHPSGSGGVGLERSCDKGGGDWLRSTPIFPGVELFEAWFRESAYRRHRHETYAIGVTERGVQAFSYRGATHRSLPGNVVVLHPDEAHDGRAGSEAGFGYRQLYVEPSLILAALRELRGEGAALPFAREPIRSMRRWRRRSERHSRGIPTRWRGTSWYFGWQKGCSRPIPESVAHQPSRAPMSPPSSAPGNCSTRRRPAWCVRTSWRR
jgi:hypothetical protein